MADKPVPIDSIVPPIAPPVTVSSTDCNALVALSFIHLRPLLTESHIPPDCLEACSASRSAFCFSWLESGKVPAELACFCTVELSSSALRSVVFSFFLIAATCPVTDDASVLSL